MCDWVKERNWYSEEECEAGRLGELERRTLQRRVRNPKRIPTDPFYIDRIPGTFLQGDGSIYDKFSRISCPLQTDDFSTSIMGVYGCFLYRDLREVLVKWMVSLVPFDTYR